MRTGCLAVLLVCVVLSGLSPGCGGADDHADSGGASADDDNADDDALDDDADDEAGDDDTWPPLPDDDADDDLDDDSADDDSADDDSGDEARVFITDEDGGTLILHGTGVSNSSKAQGHPWVTRDDVLAMSSEWGFNFVRYLVFWILIEPEPGVYDDAYLDEVAQRMDWFADAGIHVVLDLHQDLWGPSLNCLDAEVYNGAPDWATFTNGAPRWPLCEVFGWGFGYLSPDMIRAFDNFFDDRGDHPELQEHYAAMLAHLAERFRDHPAVLGYELMNEPWHGADLLREKAFDETKLHRFIQRMIDAIRPVDPDGWIFFEPRAFGPNQGLASYIPPLTDPRAGGQRLVYFPHLYPVSMDLGYYESGRDLGLKLWEYNRRREIARLRAPLAVGEWGWHGNADYERDALNMMDAMMANWAQYAYEPGGFAPEEIDGMVRTYAQRVAGRPLNFAYDPLTRVFELEFENTSDATGPTLIYIPATRHYPGGWTLSVSDADGTWSSEWDADAEVLSVRTDPNETTHTIRVEPADEGDR